MENSKTILFGLIEKKIQSTVHDKIELNVSDYPELENLSDNEVKLGYALVDLFENYETIFAGADNNKFNKNIILLSLREMTNLSTKEIRNSMKKYKKLYSFVQIRMKT